MRDRERKQGSPPRQKRLPPPPLAGEGRGGDRQPAYFAVFAPAIAASTDPVVIGW